MKMPFGLGNIGPRFFLGILNSPSKLAKSLTFTKRSGTDVSLKMTNLFCAQMKRPVSKLGLDVMFPIQLKPDSPMKIEHEYKRLGAWAYIAALDVHRMKLFGRCEHKSGIASFDRLVDQVMTQLPYRNARKLFWIVDNGSSHRGSKSANPLQEEYTDLVLIRGPVHASWLNQIEIYFLILQRKALRPNDFPSLRALEEHILNFQRYYEEIADPFEWKFARKDLDRLMSKIKTPWDVAYRLAA